MASGAVATIQATLRRSGTPSWTAMPEDNAVARTRCVRRRGRLSFLDSWTETMRFNGCATPFELDENDPRPAQIVAAMWSQPRAEELSWSGSSDWDRPESAFENLRSRFPAARTGPGVPQCVSTEAFR